MLTKTSLLLSVSKLLVKGSPVCSTLGYNKADNNKATCQKLFICRKSNPAHVKCQISNQLQENKNSY